MGENSLIIAGVVFVGLIILGLIQKYSKKPKKEKKDLCVLYMGKAYILPTECNEKQCIETDRKKNIKLYFKANKIQNFEYAEP